MKSINEQRQEFKEQAEEFADAAFPQQVDFQYELNPNLFYRTNTKGISKREYFAAMALQGLAGDIGISYYHEKSMTNMVSKKAVELADALIEALNEKEGEG